MMRVIVSGDHSSLKFEFTFVLPDLERFILLENELFAPDVRKDSELVVLNWSVLLWRKRALPP